MASMMGYRGFYDTPFLLPHIATLRHWIGKHTTDTTGERIAQMVSK
ncbi:hypothetical protein [uncultured Psychrobacter sp.]|nr:hypothetical protein [uncultured Psychrobacter sp.]